MKASFEKALGVIARGCGLKPSLVRAIVQVESSGNPRAIRYEPAFYERYVKGCSYPPGGVPAAGLQPGPHADHGPGGPRARLLRSPGAAFHP